MAELSLRVMPEVRDSARANRKFLVRAVRFLREDGIRQFLDIGTGLPTSPSTPEVARSGCPDARVVCVDNDPVVVLRAGSLIAGNRATMVVSAAGHTRLPSLRSDNCVLADCLARSTNVDAKPTASSASASHGAQIVGLVTL